MAVLLAWPAEVWALTETPASQTQPDNGADNAAKRARLAEALKKSPYRLVFESYREGNWDLFTIRPDGSDEKNLTANPGADELYPHASPDGTKMCFIVDQGGGRERTRGVYMMNADGSGRKIVAPNSRQPCWTPDGKRIAYTRQEYSRFTYSSYGTDGLYIYDIASGRHRKFPDDSINHASYLCWAPGSDLVLATVHGGMGYSHGNLAIDTKTDHIYEVEDIYGCRMDVSPDGKGILWNIDDQSLAVAEVDLKARPPKVDKVRTLVFCERDRKMYHGDWSPDGKYVAFSYGPYGSQHVGEMAKGWQICVADAAEENVFVTVTSHGDSNKEPDWMVVPPRNEEEVKK
jgi:Tol biopolymer transport system component